MKSAASVCSSSVLNLNKGDGKTCKADQILVSHPKILWEEMVCRLRPQNPFKMCRLHGISHIIVKSGIHFQQRLRFSYYCTYIQGVTQWVDFQ